MPTISPQASRALAGARITGTQLVLVEPLDRKTYLEVNVILEVLGGSWSRKAKAHLFEADPGEELAAVLMDGEWVDPKKEMSFFATPPALADYLASHAGIAELAESDWVLEPSAGCGALVEAIVRANPGVWVQAVEPDEPRANLIVYRPCIFVARQRFEDFTPVVGGAPRSYAAVVMNPPFTLPKQPSVWITHVLRALEMLELGGRLVSVVPASFGFRTDAKHTALRALVEEHGGWEPLADDAFKASGTGVRTAMIWIEKGRGSHV